MLKLQVNIYIAILYLIFIIDILLYLFAPHAMNKYYMGAIMFSVIIETLFFFKAQKDNLSVILKKIYLRHSVFFIICFVIVFFQFDLDYILGLKDESLDYVWIDTSIVCKSMALSNIALISVYLGYLMYKKNTSNNIISNYKLYSPELSKKILNLTIAFLLIIYYLLAPKELFNNGYHDGVDSGPFGMIISYMQALFISNFVLYSVIYVNKNENNWINYFKIPLLLALVYILLIVVTGRRTEAIRIVITLFISFLFCKKNNIHYKRIIVGGILFLFIFSIVGVLRSLESGGIQESIQILSSYKSISPFTAELANSVNTLHLAVSNYPNNIPYNYGSSFFPGFFNIIPGLYSFINNYIVGGNLTPSDLILTRLYFDDGDLIWGLGSSMVADVYISFGPIGVCILFMIFGYFLRYLEYYTFIFPKSLYILALSFSCYSAMIYACRSSMTIIILCWTYSCICILLVNRLGKKTE